MNKSQFLVKLCQELKSLPNSEVDKAIDYYSEIIADRIEDGIDEEEAIKELGDIKDIANSIINEIHEEKENNNDTVKVEKVDVEVINQPSNNKIKLSNNQIVLIIVLFPLWFPFTISVFSIIWGLLIAYFGVLIGCAGGSILGLVSAIRVFLAGSISGGFLNIAQALMTCGIALILTRFAKNVFDFALNTSKKIINWGMNLLKGGNH